MNVNSLNLKVDLLAKVSEKSFPPIIATTFSFFFLFSYLKTQKKILPFV